VGGSDELTEQVPEHALDKAPLAEDALIPEDKVEIPGVVDHDTGRQAGHDNLERLVAELALAVDKPRKQLPSGLEEQDAIADERERVRRLPADTSDSGGCSAARVPFTAAPSHFAEAWAGRRRSAAGPGRRPRRPRCTDTAGP